MKKKKNKDSVCSRYACNYVNTNEGVLDECDIAIAFNAGMNYVKNRLLQPCSTSPLPKISKHILVLENYGGYYGSTVIFASDFKDYMESHPQAVAWTGLDVLLPKELLPYRIGKSVI